MNLISFPIQNIPPDIITVPYPDASRASEEGLPDYLENFNSIIYDWWQNIGHFSDNYHTLSEWYLYGLSIIALLCLGFLAVTIKRSVSNIRTTSLFWVFIFTWFYGVCVYDIGMYTGENFSLLTNLPLSILYGFKIFLLESDVSEIHEQFHRNWLFSGNFALVHFLAACVTTLFLIKHFGYNFVSKCRLWWTCSVLNPRKFNDIYVFWGINEQSICLAESIQNHYSEKRKDYKIIFVRTNHDDEDEPEDRTAFNRIFDYLAMKNTELEQIQNLGCLSASTHVDISMIKKKYVLQQKGDVLGKCFRLGGLKKLLKRKVKDRVHLLLLSENEEENLHTVYLMLQDKNLKQIALPEDPEDKNFVESRVMIYCHARYNSVHIALEESRIKDGIMVKVIDSSHINVEMLKQNKELLPVNFVDVEKDASVSSSFDALVIGFSEVGQDTVRFLYEYGAFVKTGSTDSKVERSDFHLKVVDKDMDDLAGPFVANAPAIKLSMPFIKGEENPDSLISLYKMDCRSVEFYLKLEEWIKTLNYIVIATNDDELNITLGIRIFQLAIRYRKNLDKFRILVRLHKDEGEISQIVLHYNLLWLAQEAVKGVEGRDYHQKSVKYNEEAQRPICIFGLDKDIYNYNNIIDDTIHKEAVQYKERYELSSNPRYKKPLNPGERSWYRETREYMQLEGEYRDYYPSYCGLIALRRKQGQDIANTLHATTKRILAEKALEKAGIKYYDWKMLVRKLKTVTYREINGKPVDPLITRILDMLARTEHIRWNASHEIMGYEKEGKKGYRNELKMHHSYLTGWEELEDDIRSYDYNVVDISLGIISPERPIEE